MTVNYNPRIVTDGLVVYLDPANVKGYDEYENLRLYSEQFDNSAWTKSNATITANSTIAPDGTQTADALIENTTQSVGHAVSQGITYVTNQTYTASCYFKSYPGPITRNVRLQLGNASVFGTDTYININLQTGTISASSGSPSDTNITNMGNGWYRASITKQYTGPGVTSSPSIIIISTTSTSLYTDADGLSGIYLWGAQFENGSLSDYYATTTTAKTRGTSIIDLSGNSYNATLQNGVTYNTSSLGYLIFDGADDYAFINASYASFSDYNQQITVEAWVNFPTTPSDKAIVFRDGGQSTDYGLRTGSGGEIQAFFGKDATTSVSQSPALITNVWYQLNAVWSGTSALYINGQLSATNSQTLSGATDNTGNMLIARRGTGTYTSMRISAIKVYNRALTASEIRQNFNALRGRFNV